MVEAWRAFVLRPNNRIYPRSNLHHQWESFPLILTRAILQNGWEGNWCRWRAGESPPSLTLNFEDKPPCRATHSRKKVPFWSHSFLYPGYRKNCVCGFHQKKSGRITFSSVHKLHFSLRERGRGQRMARARVTSGWISLFLRCAQAFCSRASQLSPPGPRESMVVPHGASALGQPPV